MVSDHVDILTGLLVDDLTCSLLITTIEDLVLTPDFIYGFAHIQMLRSLVRDLQRMLAWPSVRVVEVDSLV